MTDRIEMFKVTECTDDDDNEVYEVEVMAGQFEGKTAYLDCMDCVQHLMSLVMIAEGLDPECLHSDRETLH